MAFPTISVVIPCFNVEAYVAEAITSVLDQQPPMHEVIIIDDGSTDGTAAALEQFRTADGVQIHRTSNSGLGPARNRGLELATGDYVYFLDSDDALAPTFSACILRALTARTDGDAKPDLVCFSGASFVDQGYTSQFLPDYTRQVTGRFATGGKAARALFDARCFFPNAYLYVASRRLWMDHGLRFKPIIHEDQELFIPLFAAAREVEVLADVLYRRRVRGDSIMTSRLSPKILAAYAVILRSLLDYPVRDDSAYATLAPVVAHRLWRSTQRYLSIADELGLPLDWPLVLRAVVRLRDAQVTARLAKLAARATMRAIRAGRVAR